MPLGGLQKAAQRFHGLLEFFGELTLLLVAPGLLQVAQTGVQAAHQRPKFLAEFGQIAGETPQFSRVNMGFGHTRLPRGNKRLPSRGAL